MLSVRLGEMEKEMIDFEKLPDRDFFLRHPRGSKPNLHISEGDVLRSRWWEDIAKDEICAKAIALRFMQKRKRQERSRNIVIARHRKQFIELQSRQAAAMLAMEFAVNLPKGKLLDSRTESWLYDYGLRRRSS